jgi:hypothetical protein
MTSRMPDSCHIPEETIREILAYAALQDPTIKL